MEAVNTEATVIDFALVNKLKAELDGLNLEKEALIKELKDKVYPVQVKDEEGLLDIISFIETEAEWNHMEALGVSQLSRELNKQKNKIKGGNIYLTGLDMDALNYFLGKAKGTGLTSAHNHIERMRYINDSYQLVQSDRGRAENLGARMDQKQYEIAAAENGISVDTSAKEKNNNN